jgi:hypothetical protein
MQVKWLVKEIFSFWLELNRLGRGLGRDGNVRMSVQLTI